MAVEINLNPVVLQRVEASAEEERSFIVNPFDINGNVINSIYVEVVTTITPPEPIPPVNASANVILPEIASLEGNSNIKITVVNIGNDGVTVVCNEADSIGGVDSFTISNNNENLVFTIANGDTWTCLST